MDKVDKKYSRLKEIIAESGSLAVAYSGGTDSNFLLSAAYGVLGDKLIAVTAQSESYPEEEFIEARRRAEKLGVKHIVIESSELDIDNFSDNPPRRCYYCKGELFREIARVADEFNIKHIADGANYDDRSDFRPGIKAADELGVLHPLMEAELTKEDIRRLSKKMGLETWDKPAAACLASRIPYGEKITERKLDMVKKAERYIRGLGIRQVRVRHHSNTARIEVPPQEINKLLKPGLREGIVKEFKKIGYIYVTADLEGFRSGSMNEVLDSSGKK
jgi:uncharacterized protein